MVRGYTSYHDLEREMTLQKRSSARSGTARTYAYSGTEQVTVIVADASPRDARIANALERTVTNEIIHEGSPLLEEGDRLVDPQDSRAYYVQSVKDPGQLGAFTIYLTERRNVEEEELP